VTWETAPDNWETAPARMNATIAAQGRKSEEVREEARSAADILSGRDPGIDYKTGIPSAAFRAGFSRMTNEAEKENYLNRFIGSGKWGKDSKGAYYLKPEALTRFGVSSKIPVAIDEQSTSRYDIADVAGDLPAIAGGVAGGMAATGLGVLPGMGMAALGAAGGKAIDEIVKNLQGHQIKTPGEVVSTIGGEAAGAALGEAGGRALMGVGRFALGPGAHRMTPEKKELAESAIEQGFQVRPGSVTEAPLLARWEGMIRNIFGDLNEGANKRAAEAGAARLRGGGSTGMEEAGEVVQSAIRKSRVNFSQAMSQRYKEVDDLVGNNPIIPTEPLKQQAQLLLEAMPKTADGTVVGGKDKLLKDILGMGDRMTVMQAQRMRTMFREASESPDIVPDVAMHEARVMRKSVDGAFDQATQVPGLEARAVNKLKAADAAYKNGIQQFDRPVVKGITKDASRNNVDPEMVVDYLIKPERVVRLRQVKQLVPAGQWAKVQEAHADSLLSNLSTKTSDPLKTIFDGQAFRDVLDKYGREVLIEVHGKEWVDAAYKYANALMLADKQMKLSGGIVAANVALHPVQNLPTLAWLRGLARVMQSPTAFKYLTDGIQLNPATKEGAAAITRVFTQAAANARDETGSAKVSVE
jgi:hypothetical protein